VPPDSVGRKRGSGNKYYRIAPSFYYSSLLSRRRRARTAAASGLPDLVAVDEEAAG
jgi:hypothetical protein